MKKVICALLALVIILSAAPFEALASETSDPYSYTRKIKLNASANSKTITLNW